MSFRTRGDLDSLTGILADSAQDHGCAARTGRAERVDVDAELALAERLRGGDTAALEALMDRYTSRVYRAPSQ